MVHNQLHVGHCLLMLLPTSITLQASQLQILHGLRTIVRCFALALALLLSLVSCSLWSLVLVLCCSRVVLHSSCLPLLLSCSPGMLVLISEEVRTPDPIAHGSITQLPRTQLRILKQGHWANWTRSRLCACLWSSSTTACSLSAPEARGGSR